MNRKEGTKHRKRKSNKLKILFWAILFAFVSVLILYLFSLGGENGIAEILNMRDYWLSVGVANGLILIGYLMMYRVDAQNIALNENDLEDTEWLSVKRLKKLKEFQVYDYKAADSKQDGIVIGAEKKGGNVEVITTSQLHALIVGTTGSGKTTGFVDQNIAVLGKSQSKPSIVISDPKKELYEKHAKNLEKQGYKISVLDLREPYSSERWNPMNVLLRRIRLVKDLENNLEQKDGKYYGAGEVFLSYRDARTRMQELKDEIYENAQDLVYTLCPVQNKDQPTWEQGARNLIFGFVLAMCEDCIKGKLDEKQLVLFNVYHNICKYCSEDTTMLKKYLMEGRDEFSKVRGLVNTVLITSDKTLTSYLSEVNSYMQQLSDDGIMSMTAENDLDIVNLDEQPNAVFIIVPDERFTRHRFVTLFITQMYKELVEKANLNLRRGEKDTAILKRNTYFVLDEFANLPKFDNIEGMVTVARSRGIRFLFVLQSYSQLTAKYGRDIGDIIKTNCKGLELTAAVNVQVKVNAAVALDRTEISLATSDQGEEHKKTDKLNATVTYNDEDYAEAEISWSSSDPEKVTVSADGTITAAGVGEATITASVTIEGEVVAATAKVTVYKPVVDPTEEIFAEINVDGSGSYQVSYDGLLAVNDKNGDKAGEGSDGTVTLGNEFIAEQSAAWLAADGDELDVEVQYELADVIYNATLTVSVDVYEMPLALSDIYTADNKVETNVSFGGKTGLLKYTAGKDFDNTMWGPHAYFAPKTDNGNIRKHFGKTVNGTEQGGKLILKMYIETENVNNWQFGVYVGDHGAVFGNEGLMSGATDGLSFVFRDYETYEVLGTPDSSLANKWFILEVNLDKWTDKSTAGDRSDWLCIGILKTGTSVYIESATAVSKNYYENDYARTDYTVEYYKDGAIIDELTAKGSGRIGSSVAAPALTEDQLKDHGLETAVIDESDSVQTLELKAKDNVLKIFYTTRSVDLDAVLTDTGDLKINKNIDGKTLVRLTDGDTVITSDEGDYLSVDADWVRSYQDKWLTSGGGALGVALKAYFEEEPDAAYATEIELMFETYQLSLDSLEVYDKNNAYEANVSFGGKTGLLKYTAGSTAYNDTMWGPHAYFMPRANNVYIRNVFGKSAAGQANGGKLILKMYIETADVNNWQFGMYLGAHGAVFGNAGWLSGAKDGTFTIRDYDTYEVIGTPDSSLANKWFILEADLDRWTDNKGANDRDDTLCIGIVKTGTSVYIESATAVSKDYYDNQFAQAEYTVEYYKDGTIVEALTKTLSAQIGTTVAAPELTAEELSENGMDGYLIDREAGMLTASLKASGTVLKVMYRNAIAIEGVMSAEGNRTISKSIVSGKTLKELKENGEVITEEAGDNLIVKAEWFASKKAAWFAGGDAAATAALTAVFTDGGEQDAELKYTFDTYELSLDSLEVYDKANTYEADVAFDGKTGLLKYTAVKDYDNSIWGPHAYFMPKADNGNIRKHFGKTVDGTAQGGKLLIKMYIETEDVNNWQFGMYIGNHGAVFGNAGWLSGAKDGTFTIRDYDTKEIYGVPDGSLANKWFILEVDLDRWADNNAGSGDRNEWLCIGILKTGTSVYIESAVAVSGDYFAAWAPEEA